VIKGDTSANAITIQPATGTMGAQAVASVQLTLPDQSREFTYDGTTTRIL
jgi:hypothetical protein